MSRIVFITGATGFLGSAVLTELLSAGYEARCLVRREVDLPEGAHLVRGDLQARDNIATALAGCDAVLHLAAMVKDWVPRAERGRYREVNVDGLRSLMELAEQAKVPRFLYTSSFFALGPTDGEPEFLGDESMPPREGPFQHLYEGTKSEARTLFLNAMKGGFPGTILYPTVIYGPGPLTEGNHVAEMIADFRAGKVPGIPGSGKQLWCFARVADVARGHRLALEAESSGKSYVLGGENRTLSEFFAELERQTGARAPRLKVPIGVLRMVGRAQEMWAAITGRAPRLTSGGAGLYRHHWGYRSDTAKRELGYDPTGVSEGLQETIAWLDQPG